MEVKGSQYIEGRWRPGSGQPLVSTNPATGEELWKGSSASPKDVDAAVASARSSAAAWSGLSLEQRITFLRTFATKLIEKHKDLATAIAMETGKPLWEAETEVTAMMAKVDISIEAYRQRCPEKLEAQGNARALTRHKPHGVVAVFGPYNFPGHLPNGHIVPALLAGNAVLFKPSELTPLVAELIVDIWHSAGLPPGVLTLLQGGRDTGQSLAQHPQIDGVLFTGSARTGQYLSKLFAAYPEKILALEMGGNNPLVVTSVSDLTAAAYLTIASAFLTSGQRCTCARRLIVPIGPSGDQFVALLVEMMSHIHIDRYDGNPSPFMGPVISGAAAKQLLDSQDKLLQGGAVSIVPMTTMKLGEAFLCPGLIDVTQVGERPDEEIFGPLLQLIRVRGFEGALEEANNTRFGLSAGIFTDNRDEFERFYRSIRAGVVNWNLPLTGASSRMPFGGVGISGNHRPSAFYAADYCAFPVASMESDRIELPPKLLPGITL